MTEKRNSLRKLRFSFFIMAIFLSRYSLSQNDSAKAQSLVKKEFKVCNKKLQLEIADNDQSRSTGLMYREGIAVGTGMLFVFPYDLELSFWMKNVPFDIDIGFFDKNGKLLNSMTMAATSPLQKVESLAHYKSQGLAMYAVEASAGFFKKITKLSKCKLNPLPGPSKS